MFALKPQIHLMQDRTAHTLNFIEHVAVPKPDHIPAEFAKISRAPPVKIGLFSRTMRFTVHFDGELGRAARKIDDVFSNKMLAPKL